MNKTVKLAFTAVLTAFAVAANFATIPIAPNKFVSFTIVFSFLAGIYLGVLPAVAVGFLGDLIGHFIHPFGAYNFFVGLSCALCGLIPALVYKLKIHRLWKLVISLALFFVLGSALCNTFGLWLQIIVGVDPSPIGLFQFFAMDKGGIKKSFWLYLVGRMPTQAINLVVNGVIVGVLQQTKALDKLFEKIKLSQDKRAAEKQNASANVQSDDVRNGK